MVAKETGLTLEWVRKFAQGAIKEPGASRLGILQMWLGKKRGNGK